MIGAASAGICFLHALTGVIPKTRASRAEIV